MRGQTVLPLLRLRISRSRVIGTLDLLAEFQGIGHVELFPDGHRLMGSGYWHDFRDGGDYAVTAGSGRTVIDAAILEVVARSHRASPTRRRP